MGTADKIFAYCERGPDPGFWAEPVNALTNLGFVFAGLAASWLLLRRPREESKFFRYLLILNLIIIGIGSFLFHTYATKWAASADVIPIGIFMLAYLGYALYVFAGAPLLLAIPAIASFAYVIKMALQFDCRSLDLSLPILERTNCLNGSFGYLPALGAMLLIGAWLGVRRHPAAAYIMSAGLTFAVSISFRAVDRIWCRDITFMDQPLGTHFFWHLCNSVVLFLLVLAAIRHGGQSRRRTAGQFDQGVYMAARPAPGADCGRRQRLLLSQRPYGHAPENDRQQRQCGLGG